MNHCLHAAVSPSRSLVTARRAPIHSLAFVMSKLVRTFSFTHYWTRVKRQLATGVLIGSLLPIAGLAAQEASQADRVLAAALTAQIEREFSQAQQTQTPQGAAKTILLSAMAKNRADYLATIESALATTDAQTRQRKLMAVSAALTGTPLSSLAHTTAYRVIAQQAKSAQQKALPVDIVRSPPTASDLSATVDAPFTGEIRALATSLNNNPVAILSWVQSNVDFVPTRGSIQGAAGALATRRANATDTASLVIALLRASQVPARYATGTIEVPTTTMLAWLRSPTDASAALQLLEQGGLEATVTTNADNINVIRVSHVWVEAWVDATPSRGARNLGGDTWVAIDASFKPYRQTPSQNSLGLARLTGSNASAAAGRVTSAVTFDSTAGRVDGISAASLQQEITSTSGTLSSAIGSINGVSTVGDLFGKSIPEPPVLPVFALSLPYVVTDQSALSATVDDGERFRLAASFYKTSLDQANNVAALSLDRAMPELVGKALSLRFVPAGSTDATELARLLGTPASTLSALPNRLATVTIEMRGELWLDGSKLGEFGPLKLGQPYFGEIGLNRSGDASADYRIALSGRAGETRVFGWDLVGNTSAQLTERKTNLASLTNKSGSDAVVESLQGALDVWFASHDVYAQWSADVAQSVVHRHAALGSAHTWLDVELNVGVPVATQLKGLAIGESPSRWLSAARSSGDANRLRWSLTQLGSSLSHVVGEQWTSGQGVSALRVLSDELANRKPVWSITTRNKGSLANLGLVPTLQQRLSNAVDAGSRVSVNASDATLVNSDWRGRAIIHENPTTRDGTSWIDGAGVAVAPNLIATNSVMGGARSTSYAAGASWLTWQIPGASAAILPSWQTLHTPATTLATALSTSAADPGAQRLTAETLNVLSGMLIDRAVGPNVDPLIDQHLWAGLLLPHIKPTTLTETVPPTLTLTADNTTVNIGQGITITLTASDASGIAEISLSANGDPPITAVRNGVPLPFATPTAGLIDFVATARDNAGNTSRATLRITVRDPSDTTPPTLKINDPIDGDEVTDTITVRGDVTDPSLREWRLQISSVNADGSVTAGSAIELARGVNTGTNLVLGKFDPSVFDNGSYRLELLGTDTAGNQAGDAVRIVVRGDLKIGQFSLTFKDMEIDVGGLPLTVYRTYDTRRRAEKLDFGFGWSVNYQDVSVKTNRTVGIDWTIREIGSGLNKQLCVNSMNAKVATVRLPGGKLERFDIKAKPECQSSIAYYASGGFVGLQFIPRGNTTSQLEAIDLGDLRINGDTLLDLGAVEAADPKQFKMTTQEGTAYYLDRNFGLRQIKDTSGNTIDFTANQIVHSGGKSIFMDRDAQGRIVKVSDANDVGLRYSYDANGDLAQISDARNQATTLAYGTGRRAHLLTRYTDPSGQLQMRAEYDDLGRLVAQYDGLGNKIELDHSQRDQGKQLVKDRRGNTTEYAFNIEGNITQETDALGGVTRYGYDAKGYETSKTDPLGNTMRKTYDALGNVTSETDPLGNVTSMTLNQAGNPKEITDALGRVTKNDYDDSGSLKKITDPLGGNTSIAYGAKGELGGVTDATGKSVVRYSYANGVTGSDGGRLPDKSYDGNNVATSYTYDDRNRRTSETVSRTDNGASVTVSTLRKFDANGNVIEETDALGEKTLTEYDGLNRPVKVTDANGRVTTNRYDAAGRVTRVTAPDGSFTQTAYDANGNEIRVSDQLGNATEHTYDALNRLTDIKAADGSTAKTEYDAAGRVTKTIDARGNAMAYEYDAAGRKTQQTDALGRVTQYAYDAVGNMTAMTDSLGQVTRYTYDANNRRTKTTLPSIAGASTPVEIKVEYDAAGRKLKDIDADGQATLYAYDNNGRLNKVTDANGNVTEYGYDELGNKVSQKDGKGNETKFRYDNANRLIERALPAGQKETFSYDAVGNKTAHTDFNGASTAWVYDSLNRPTLETRKDASGATLSTLAIGYDAAGKVTKLTDSRGDTVHVYNSVNRLTKKTEPGSGATAAEKAATAATHDYGYDANGNLTSHTLIIGTAPNQTTRTTTYEWDAGNQLVKLVAPDHANVNQTTTFEYDGLGRKVKQTSANGVVTSWTYDAQNRTTEVAHAKLTTPSAPHAKFSYEHNARGQRTKKTETFVNPGNVSATPPIPSATLTRTSDYQYDLAGKLTKETITEPSGRTETSWTYDAVGNRSGEQKTFTPTSGSPVTQNTTYLYDANDRLTQLNVSGGSNPGSTNYTWNEDGSLRTQTQGTTSRSYTWQKFGQEARLKSVTLRDSASANDPTKNKRVDYTLDGEGNRIEKQVQALDASGTPSGASTKTKYVIDSNRSYAEAVAEIDYSNAASISIQRHNTFTPTGTGELLQIAKAAQTASTPPTSAATLYPGSDALGSLQVIADQTGNMIAALAQDAWGASVTNIGLDINLANAATITIAAITEYGYAGERTDFDTGLTHLRAREYAPHIGRFVSADGAWARTSSGVAANTYTYASAEPINLIDPHGYFSMGEMGVSMNVMGTLSTQSIARFAIEEMISRALLEPLIGAAISSVSNSRNISFGNAGGAALLTAFAAQCRLSKRCFFRKIPVLVNGIQSPMTSMHIFDSLMGNGDTIDGVPRPLPFVLIRGPRRAVSATHMAAVCGRPRPTGMQCDEYPYATTLMGGTAAYLLGQVSLRNVPGLDNGAHGNRLGRFYGGAGVGNGEVFINLSIPFAPTFYIDKHGRSHLLP
jgi:RHS repeat-associated protein